MNAKLAAEEVNGFQFSNSNSNSSNTHMSINQRIILVADDAADTRLIASRSLEFDGFRCVQASNGKEVLELAKSSNPQLIVLDLMMPSLNGFQILLWLKNSKLACKVCVISSLDDDDFIKQAFEFGADDYLIKPILPEVLSYKVKFLLDGRGKNSFFAANADLRASLVCEDGTHPCRIISISEVGVHIVGDHLPQPEGKIMRLQCTELERLMDISYSIYVRYSSPLTIKDYGAHLDFIALHHSEICNLRSLVARGKYVSAASLNN